MRSLLNRTLILLAVFGLICSPPMLTGYHHLRQAEAAYQVKDYQRAAPAYQRAATLLFWRPDLWNRAGETHYRSGDFAGAIRALEFARSHGVLSDTGWDALGMAYFELGDTGSAAQAWELGLEAYPAYARFYAHLIYIYHEQGNIQAERNALEMWVLSDGVDDAFAHYRLGQLLAISEQERALDEFLAAASLDAQFAPAVKTMQSALDLAAPENDKARKLVFIGRGLGLIGEWSLAAEAYRRAVAADGENPEAWAWLGEAEQQLGRGGRAELERAMSLGRTNPVVRSLRGLYWMRQGRPQQALAEYLLAAEYDPQNPAWQVSIADSYVSAGDLQAALRYYLRATEMAPKDATYWRLLANFCASYSMQIEQVGLPAAQKAVELNDEDPLALDMLGWTLTLLERYDLAQSVLKQALRLDPTLAQAHLHFGIVALQTDDWQTARDSFRQARDLDGDGPAGKQAQILLNQYFP